MGQRYNLGAIFGPPNEAQLERNQALAQAFYEYVVSGGTPAPSEWASPPVEPTEQAPVPTPATDPDKPASPLTVINQQLYQSDPGLLSPGR